MVSHDARGAPSTSQISALRVYVQGNTTTEVGMVRCTGDHEEPHHEELGCSKCNRKFWGVLSYDVHRPCDGNDFVRTTHVHYRVNGATLYHVTGGPYVHLDCYEWYKTMMERVAKARAGRDSKAS